MLQSKRNNQPLKIEMDEEKFETFLASVDWLMSHKLKESVCSVRKLNKLTSQPSSIHQRSSPIFPLGLDLRRLPVPRCFHLIYFAWQVPWLTCLWVGDPDYYIDFTNYTLFLQTTNRWRYQSLNSNYRKQMLQELKKCRCVWALNIKGFQILLILS